MERLALLIGVSEYGDGLTPLPGSVMDVDALQRVLVNPEMGEFAPADITVLKNPQRQVMEEAIYKLFDNRKRDDLLLFYFSGHGIKDELGNLYLGTCNTRKKEDGKLYEPSAVPATYIHQLINNSRSQRQILILDSCFSGAIAKGMTVKDSGIINLENYLGGQGRAILTSSTATEYSFGGEVTAHENSGLSIYTRYLVEGIETGAADADEDDFIAVQELHEYAYKRVKEASPAMNPEFYPVKEGYKIILAKSRNDDPKLKYRKEVQRRLAQGQIEFSIFARQLLDNQRIDWGLSEGDAKAIEDEVLQPYREYQRKLREYEQVLTEAVQTQYPFDLVAESDLSAYQKYLKLRDADIAEIERRVLEPRKVEDERQPEPVSPPIDSSTSRQPFQFPDIFPRRNFLKWAGFGVVGLLGTLWWAQTYHSNTPTTPEQTPVPGRQLVTPDPVPLLR